MANENNNVNEVMANGEETLTTEQKKKAINLQDLIYLKKYIDDREADINSKIEAAVSSAKSEFNNKIDSTKIEVSDEINSKFNSVYPIGSIYMSISNTNPETLFGGTWAAWGNGRVPVGVGEDERFNAAEKEGGEYEHILSLYEMPYHNHPQQITQERDDESGQDVISLTYQTTVPNPDPNGVAYAVSMEHQVKGKMGYIVSTNGITTSNGTIYDSDDISDFGKRHNNIQPYITCYMWKRIA